MSKLDQLRAMREAKAVDGLSKTRRSVSRAAASLPEKSTILSGAEQEAKAGASTMVPRDKGDKRVSDVRRRPSGLPGVSSRRQEDNGSFPHGGQRSGEGKYPGRDRKVHSSLLKLPPKTALSSLTDSGSSPDAPTTAKRGRPKIGAKKLPRAEPWKALKMSERTYYRRQAEERGAKRD